MRRIIGGRLRCQKKVCERDATWVKIRWEFVIPYVLEPYRGTYFSDFISGSY
jgi:hypothetical protein